MPRTITRPERLENCACFSVRKASRAITRTFDSALAPSGLEATQFSVLAALGAATRYTISELAEWLGVDRTTLSRNLRPLARAGYVALSKDSDQRRRFVRLSPAGRRKLASAFPLWRSAQRRLISAFGRHRFVRLLDGLADIRDLAG